MPLQMLPEGSCRRRQFARAADADVEMAHRPGVGETRHMNGRTPSASPRRRFRHDGQADAVANHPTDGVEAGETYAQLEKLARRGRLLPEILLESVGRGHADEFVIEQGRE